MDSFLSVQPGLLVWSIVNFVLFLVVLYAIGGKKFINNIITREDYIQQTINNAEEQKQTLERLVAENERKMLEAQKNMDEVINKATEEAKLQAEQIIAEAQKSRDIIVNDAKIEIEHNKKLAVQAIRSEMADLVIIATEKVIEEKLSKEKDKAIIDKYLQQISNN